MSSADTLEHTHAPEETLPTPEGQTTPDAATSAPAPTLNPECTRQVEVEVPAEEVARAFRTATKRYQKAARIPGFRAGKVPESLIRGRFAEQIRQETMEALLPEHFRRAIAEQKLQPVSQPQVTHIDLEEGKPLHFKAAFEVLPEISIEGYRDVSVSRPDTALTDAEFDAEMDHIRDSRSTMEPVSEDRPLADGDFAEIGFTGAIAGETEAEAGQPIEGKDVMIEVGGKNTLDSFNAALRGARPGQQLKFETSYPEDFGERRLAGKTVAYDVEVKAIKKRIQPELNDAFAKELGDYENFADFSQKLREHLAEDKKRRLENHAKDQLLEALAAKYTFPIPESLVQQQVDARLDRGLRALAAQGMRAEDMRKLDFGRLRAAQRESAAAEIKGSILLDRIAAEENVDVSGEDVERELQILSVQTREPLETLRARLTEDGGLARIREQLRREKTGALLYERQAS